MTFLQKVWVETINYSSSSRFLCLQEIGWAASVGGFSLVQGSAKFKVATEQQQCSGGKHRRVEYGINSESGCKTNVVFWLVRLCLLSLWPKVLNGTSNWCGINWENGWKTKYFKIYLWICLSMSLSGVHALYNVYTLPKKSYFNVFQPMLVFWSYLIFVADTIDIVCGEIFVMWRNFCPVEKF